MNDRYALALAGTLIGIAALALFVLALGSPAAGAAGWDAASVSVSLDSTYLDSGELLTIRVSGSDTDMNETNNLAEFDLRLVTSGGTAVASWTDQVIGAQDEVVIEFRIPQSLRSGSYYVRAFRPGETQPLDSAYLYITQLASIDLQLYDSTLYQGDIMMVIVRVANASVTQASLFMNASDGRMTAMGGPMAVSLGDNYLNWTVPRSLKTGSYYLEAYVPGEPERVAYERVSIYRPYVYHSADLSPGKYSYSMYAPGETVTIRLRGAELANYTVNVSRDTYVMKSWPMVQLDARGQTNLTLIIPANAGDGVYNVTMIAEDGTEFVVDYMTVQMYLIDLYPERSEFLEGETFTVFYTVRNLMDGALAAPASGTWQLYEGSRNLRDSGTFNAPSGSFSVRLPVTGSYPDYTLRVWYNDTAASRSTYASEGISTGPLSFSIDSDENTYQPGGVVVLSLRTTVGSGYNAPAPGVPVTMVKVFTRASGGQWAPDGAYSIQPAATDAMGRSQLVMIILSSTADLTEFRVDATAAKGTESRNDSAYFNVRRSSDISATIRLDRTAYTAGQVMRISVATYAPNVTGQLTFTYRIVAGSPYSYSSRVLLVRTSPSSSLDWTLPGDLEGSVYIYVSISGPNGASGGTSASAPVAFGSMTVNASPGTYRANATVRITYAFSGGGTETPQLFAKITDSDGNLVLERQLAGGRSGGFDFKVPAAASDEYEVEVFAYQNGRVLASGTLSLSREMYYTLELSVDRDTVAPGEKVRISYKVVRHGQAPAIGEPATIKYGDFTFQNQVQTTKMEGSFEYKVPSGATEGPLTIYVTWTPMSSETGAVSSVTVTATRAAGGFAMSRSDALLGGLAVISLVVAVIAVLMARRLSKALKAQGAPPQAPMPPAPPVQPYYPPPQPAPQPAYQPPPAPPVPPQQPAYQPPPQPQNPSQQAPPQPAYQPPSPQPQPIHPVQPQAPPPPPPQPPFNP